VGKRRDLVVRDKENSDAADFERLEKISEYLENEEFSPNNTPNYRAASSYEGSETRTRALKQHRRPRGQPHRAPSGSMALRRSPEGVKRAGEAIISAINPEDTCISRWRPSSRRQPNCP